MSTLELLLYPHAFNLDMECMPKKPPISKKRQFRQLVRATKCIPILATHALNTFYSEMHVLYDDIFLRVNPLRQHAQNTREAKHRSKILNGITNIRDNAIADRDSLQLQLLLCTTMNYSPHLCEYYSTNSTPKPINTNYQNLFFPELNRLTTDLITCHMCPVLYICAVYLALYLKQVCIKLCIIYLMI